MIVSVEVEIFIGFVDRDEGRGVVGCSGRLMVDIPSRALYVGGMQMPLCFPHVHR
jgi:hypothetical protein